MNILDHVKQEKNKRVAHKTHKIKQKKKQKKK